MGWQFAHPSKDSLYGHAEPAFCHAEYPTIRTENRASGVGRETSSKAWYPSVMLSLSKHLPMPKNERKILRQAQNDKGNREKTKVQSQIPVTLLVEQKTGILAVLSAPLLELAIQKMLKKAKN